jgi:sec-independent protein translocase protein TatC
MADQVTGSQAFIQHVHELRRRLMWPAALVLVGGIAGYLLRNPIQSWLQHPLHDKLYYTSPTGGFDFLMQLCFTTGVILALPVFICQLIYFIRPALPKDVKRYQIILVAAISTLLAAGGVAFGYYLSLPTALHFLQNIGLQGVSALIGATDYFSFVLKYLLMFAVVFQLPLVLLFIDSIRPLPPAKLWRYQAWVVVGAFVVPMLFVPEPIGQLIMALPVIILYDLSIGIIWLRHRRTPKPAKDEAVAIEVSVPTPEPVAPALPPSPPPQRTARANATIDLRAMAGGARGQREATTTAPVPHSRRARVLDLSGKSTRLT